MQGRWWWWYSHRKLKKNHLRLAFACEGGGGGGSHVETAEKTTSSSRLDAREVVVVALWVYRALVVVEEEGMGENGQRLLSLPVFVTHYAGLPLPGSPLIFLHPQLFH